MVTYQYIPNIDILGNESNGWFIINVFAEDGKIYPIDFLHEDRTKAGHILVLIHSLGIWIKRMKMEI